MEIKLSQAQQRMADSLTHLFTGIREYKAGVYFMDEFAMLTYGAGDPFMAIRTTRRCMYGHFWDAGIAIVLQYLEEPFTRMEEDIKCPIFGLNCKVAVFYVPVNKG
jgi:hypothetical protein